MVFQIAVYLFRISNIILKIIHRLGNVMRDCSNPYQIGELPVRYFSIS
ncbi:hypothetical protein SDC9_141986 [bioreactor metagenome]|uniref:Uncharacterized protein n=1 Tax=bioreactor metagenome TaxID=1076179 RepID=A0A645E0E1_9ZZZZ